MSENIYDTYNSMYNKKGYFTLYAGDLFMTAFICTLVFVIVSYYHVMNSIQPIKADWVNQKCNPAVIPFAGLINKPSNESILDFTSSNFVNCIQATLEDVVEYALMPLYYVMNLLIELMKTLAESINTIRALFDKMRNNMNSISSSLFGRSLNMMLPVVHMFQSIRSMFGKIQGSITAAIYTLYGGYLTMNSTFIFIYDVVLTIMWIIVGIIIACFAIGWLVPPLLTAGLALSGFLAILMIPLVFMTIIMQDIFSTTGLKSAPSIPHYCFAGSTQLQLQGGNYVAIKDACPGQILADGSKITGVMRSTSAGMEMFKLNNIIVTSKHMVYHRKLGWIHISKHPRSTFVDDFREEYVYCIGTTSKIIKIGSTIFSDWDEITDLNMEKLIVSLKCCDKLPFGFTKNDIHKHMDSGLHPDTLLYLDDGRAVPIKNIEVNDVLYFGEEVKTIVKISCHDINFCSFRHGDLEILRGTENLDVSIHSLENDAELVKVKIDSPSFAYHIVTNNGFIYTNGLKIGDYNQCIDQYLCSNTIQKHNV